MSNRYCRNCGHELAQDDRFCPNCGTPVHEAAHVRTPEADRPVPRILPAAERTAWQRIRYGTLDAPQQTEAPPRSRSTASKLLFGRAGLFVVLILFVGCLAVWVTLQAYVLKFMIP